ncbi:hypothetical protein D3C76_1212730 [compost metagenome]
MKIYTQCDSSLAIALFSSTTIHLECNIRGNVDRFELFAYIVLGLCTALISRLAKVTQRHGRVLLQPGRAVLQEEADKVVPRRYLRVDQLLTQAQVFLPTEREVTAHGAVLQVDIGLVMTILGRNTVQPIDL